MSIASQLSRSVGWTPVGKLVEIKIDESSFPSLIGRILSARIIALNNNDTAVLEMAEPIEQGTEKIQSVVVYPRHKGYDFYHLGVGAIAVDLSLAEETQGIEKQDKRFASGLIKCI